jgi:hypothetical protein
MASLIKSNKYLRDPAMREEALIRNVVSSSSIDGIRVSPEQLQRKSKCAESTPETECGEGSAPSLTRISS